MYPMAAGPPWASRKRRQVWFLRRLPSSTPRVFTCVPRPLRLYHGKFACDVTVVTPEKEVNGKSPMALMAAGIPCGTEVEIRCDGADEADALTTAIELIKSGLGE